MERLITFIVVALTVLLVAYSVSGEKSSPADHIAEHNVMMYNDRVVINVEGAHWAKFPDTNSMDPVFDSEANTIEIKPKIASDVSVGDIVSYHNSLYPGIVIHRVVFVGYDADGWYCELKGDNNFFRDAERVRFSQINGLVVAVLY